MSKTILSVEKLCKYYSGVAANRNISFSIEEGEIHSLAGENGAGKSTLIKMLTGAIRPSEGKIVIRGEDYAYLLPDQAIELGISTVYQEFNLVPYLSVAENIFLGKEPMKKGLIDHRKMLEQAREIFRSMEIDLDPQTQVASLGVAYQQLVEIAKAVSSHCRILILDEPTAPLTKKECEILFKVVRRLNDSGVTIIYISHRLEEIFSLCDRVSVLRDGQLIDTYATDAITEEDLVRAMIGRSLEETYPEKRGELGEVLFEARDLASADLRGVSFQLRKGEVLGFGGLVGAGRSELMETLFGARRLDAGEMLWEGRPYRPASPRQALARGIGLIPEDRKRQGVHLSMNVEDNTLMCSFKKCMRSGVIRSALQRKIAYDQQQRLRIKTPSLRQLVRNLSGGNQQKVVLAKILSSDCKLIIFDEPTRGIDVGAKQEIYTIMRELAEAGKCIIMVSSDMPELLGMSDRICVMRRGRIVGELAKEEFSQESVLLYAAGLKKAHGGKG